MRIGSRSLGEFPLAVVHIESGAVRAGGSHRR